jgi:hypothetical protein
VRKYEKKVNIDENLVEKELENLWNEELTKMLAINRQKVQNYLLGQTRKKFIDYPLQELILTISGFLGKK